MTTSGTTIVYDVTNLINGKRYIGITTKSLSRRKAQHCWEGRRGQKRAKRLHAAIRKYGAEMFRFRALARYPSLAEAKAEEIRLIALCRPEYNITQGGESAAGRICSAAERERLGSYRKGKPGTFLGRKHTAETKAKMRAWRAANDHKPRLGVRRPGSGKKGYLTKLARGTISRWRAKAVICLNDGRIFASGSAAARTYRLAPSLVNRVCAGTRTSTHGLHFVWVQS